MIMLIHDPSEHIFIIMLVGSEIAELLISIGNLLNSKNSLI